MAVLGASLVDVPPLQEGARLHISASMKYDIGEALSRLLSQESRSGGCGIQITNLDDSRCESRVMAVTLLN